jgi:hypothetical protein
MRTSRGPTWIVPAGFLEEGAIPAAGLQRPRAGEDAAVDDDGPDADEAVIGTSAGAHPEDLRRIVWR